MAEVKEMVRSTGEESSETSTIMQTLARREGCCGTRRRAGEATREVHSSQLSQRLSWKQDGLELEFAGQTVPARGLLEPLGFSTLRGMLAEAGATVQMMNLADGDTLRLVPA